MTGGHASSCDRFASYVSTVNEPNPYGLDRWRQDGEVAARARHGRAVRPMTIKRPTSEFVVARDGLKLFVVSDADGCSVVSYEGQRLLEGE